MAVPVLVHGGQTRAPTAARVAPSALRMRRFDRRSYWWILLGLSIVALLSRVYTTNSLAGEPTADEYLYAVYARDLARDWAAGVPISPDALSAEGRSAAVEAAALSLVLPWDPLTDGRTLQALFNALCIPMTFVLGRQIGLPRSAALVGAVLLMAVPEFQESAWRFWTDSQATFIVLIYLAALVALTRRPSLVTIGLSLMSLAALLLTKESAAVSFTPLLILAAAVPLSRRLGRSGRRYAAIGGGLAVVVLVGLGVLLARAPALMARMGLLQKTFGVAPLILRSLLDAVPQVPSYSDTLVSLMGPDTLGTGVLWATLLGAVWLAAQACVAAVTAQRSGQGWLLGWLAAALVWLPGVVTPARDLAALGGSDAWVLVGAAGLLVIVGTIASAVRNGHRGGWGFALLGLVVLMVLLERLVILVTPKLSETALTFRSLMPTVPLLALLAAGGLSAAAAGVAVLVPSARSARAIVAVAASLILVTFWSPLLRQRTATQPLLGRVADRGADPDTPQGLRVDTLVEAQPWLLANLRPSDTIITGRGIPRMLAWYADLGVDGMDMLIDLGSQPRTPEEARAYTLQRVGPTGAEFVVDFNVDWMDPAGDAARQWQQTFETLAALPNIEVAYLKRDKYGNPVFYVLRNYGYATAPGH